MTRILQLRIVSPLIGDLIAIVGVFGTAATLYALWIAIKQLRRQATAAEEVGRATKELVEEVERRYNAHVAANARRYFADLKEHVQSERWEHAVARASDLSEQIAQLPETSEDRPIRALLVQLHEWEGTLRKQAMSGEKLAKSVHGKWLRFFNEMSSVLNDRSQPLADLMPNRRNPS